MPLIFTNSYSKFMKTEQVQHTLCGLNGCKILQTMKYLTTDSTDPNVRRVTEMVRKDFCLLFRSYHKN